MLKKIIILILSSTKRFIPILAKLPAKLKITKIPKKRYPPKKKGPKRTTNSFPAKRILSII